MKNKMICCPFIHHEERWYIIIGWSKTMKAGRPLHLRPLDRKESRLVDEYMTNFSAEAWAVIAAKNQRRTASTSR